MGFEAQQWGSSPESSNNVTVMQKYWRIDVLVSQYIMTVKLMGSNPNNVIESKRLQANAENISVSAWAGYFGITKTVYIHSLKMMLVSTIKTGSDLIILILFSGHSLFYLY